jgi:hypothetical protein
MKLHVHRKLSTYNICSASARCRRRHRYIKENCVHLRTASTADTLLIDKISIASANCPQSVSKIDSSKRFFKKFRILEN